VDGNDWRRPGWALAARRRWLAEDDARMLEEENHTRPFSEEGLARVLVFSYLGRSEEGYKRRGKRIIWRLGRRTHTEWVNKCKTQRMYFVPKSAHIILVPST
jgi:hypothetical protein